MGYDAFMLNDSVSNDQPTRQQPVASNFVDQPTNPAESAVSQLTPDAVSPTPYGIPNVSEMRFIARGGNGEVYSGKQLPLGRAVAVKLLTNIPFGEEILKQRFLEEGKALAKLQHPGVVQVYFVGEVSNIPYLIMEWVGGGTLLSEMEYRKKYEPKEAARILRQLADAVAAIHRAGIIHRDLKPANILLQKNETGPKYKIADFGIARFLDFHTGLTRAGTALGTVGYMSPEQALSIGLIGPPSDIFSLGVIFYQMLTGNAPPLLCNNTTRVQDAGQGVKLQFDIPKELPADVRMICESCLKLEPADRYPTAVELTQDLDLYLSDEPVKQRKLNRWERLVRWQRKNRGLAATFLVGAIALPIITYSLILTTIARNKVEAEYKTVADILRNIDGITNKSMLSPSMKQVRLALQKLTIPHMRRYIEEQREASPLVSGPLAAQLGDLGIYLWEAGQKEEAALLFQEAASIWKQTKEADETGRLRSEMHSALLLPFEQTKPLMRTLDQKYQLLFPTQRENKVLQRDYAVLCEYFGDQFYAVNEQAPASTKWGLAFTQRKLASVSPLEYEQHDFLQASYRIACKLFQLEHVSATSLVQAHRQVANTWLSKNKGDEETRTQIVHLSRLDSEQKLGRLTLKLGWLSLLEGQKAAEDLTGPSLEKCRWLLQKFRFQSRHDRNPCSAAQTFEKLLATLPRESISDEWRILRDQAQLEFVDHCLRLELPHLASSKLLEMREDTLSPLHQLYWLLHAQRCCNYEETLDFRSTVLEATFTFPAQAQTDPHLLASLAKHLGVAKERVQSTDANSPPLYRLLNCLANGKSFSEPYTGDPAGLSFWWYLQSELAKKTGKQLPEMRLNLDEIMLK